MLIDGTEWRLVPVEPSDEMLDVFQRAWGEATCQHATLSAITACYQDMLAAAPTPPAATAAPSDDELIQFVGGDDGELVALWTFDRDEIVWLCRNLLSRYGGRQAPADWVAEADRLISAFVRAELGRNNEARQAAAQAMRQHLLLHPAAQAPATPDWLRNAVLEEAAQACESREQRCGRQDMKAVSRLCARDIRALKAPADVNQQLTTEQAPAADGDALEDYKKNGAAAVRFAPSSAHWSNELRRLFGSDARDGIDRLEERLRAAEQGAARWRHVRRKLCLTGNGDGTCSMHAINLPASIPGWPEPNKVSEFCDAAVDAAIAAGSPLREGGKHGDF